MKLCCGLVVPLCSYTFQSRIYFEKESNQNNRQNELKRLLPLEFLNGAIWTLVSLFYNKNSWPPIHHSWVSFFSRLCNLLGLLFFVLETSTYFDSSILGSYSASTQYRFFVLFSSFNVECSCWQLNSCGVVLVLCYDWGLLIIKLVPLFMILIVSLLYLYRLKVKTSLNLPSYIQ